MWIKICGLTDPKVAAQVAVLRPDAVGLNFYRSSPRCVTVDVATQVAAALPSEVEPIGVFVNHAAEDVLSISRRVGLRTVQLHGDETPEFAAPLQAAGLEIIRAFRVGEAGMDEVDRHLSEYRRLGIELRACLVDSRVAGSFGGTGHTAPWDMLAASWQCDWPPLILAGGLRPDNVAAAIRVVRPWGVDTASGVELAPGRQDPAVARTFIEAARAAR